MRRVRAFVALGLALAASLFALGACEEPDFAYRCETDDQCGQVLAGTSCGCTRNLVARNDADLADLEEIRAKAEANECSLGGISTCDCPAADGFACESGSCTWNYVQG